MPGAPLILGGRPGLWALGESRRTGIRGLMSGPPLILTMTPPLVLMPLSLTIWPGSLGVPSVGLAPSEGLTGRICLAARLGVLPPGVQIISLGVPGVLGESGSATGTSGGVTGEDWAPASGDCTCTLTASFSSSLFRLLASLWCAASNMSKDSANFLVSSSNIPMKSSSAVFLPSESLSFSSNPLGSETLMSFTRSLGRSSSALSLTITTSSSGVKFDVGAETGAVVGLMILTEVKFGLTICRQGLRTGTPGLASCTFATATGRFALVIGPLVLMMTILGRVAGRLGLPP